MCKYGEICSPLFRCHFCRLDARLELRIKEAFVEQQTRRIGFFTFPEPVVVERQTLVVEDSSPGLSFLGATLGGLLGSALSNRRKVVVDRRQKALPSKRKK